jgi:hypothetical protein
MLIELLLLLVISAVANAWFVTAILPDPYRDIPAQKPYAVEIPDMTFDPRGLI